ncbi:MAG: DinB family protein [Acidobacteriota bacterium]
MTCETEFLRYAAEKLDQQCSRIEVCVAKLTPEQIWWRGGESQNAIGNLLLHLTGNVRQWILTGIDHAPNTRIRDAEFQARGGIAPDTMTRALRDAVEKAVLVVRQLPAERLTERIDIQGHNVTLVEVIFHVVEHFSGHAGQIILMTKAFTGSDLGFYSYLSQPGSASGQTP